MSRASGGPGRDDSGGVSWLNFIASAVLFFQIQPSEAWLLSPQEYWCIFDMKMDMNKPKVDYPTPEESAAQERDLARRGII